MVKIVKQGPVAAVTCPCCISELLVGLWETKTAKHVTVQNEREVNCPVCDFTLVIESRQFSFKDT